MYILCAWAAAALAAAASAAAPGASLVVRFEGLAPQGQVQVAVFNSAAAWKRHSRPVRMATLKLSGASTAEARFEGLAPGAYGVMAYQDRNANGRLDTLPVGLPVEPYGFSNNVRGTFGPPPWSSANVSLQAGEARVQDIRLK